MVPPVEQVGAGNVSPVVAALVLEDVEQVVAALPVDGPVGIEGHAAPFRRDEVVARPVGVAEQFLAEGTVDAVGVAEIERSVRRCPWSPSGTRRRDRGTAGRRRSSRRRRAWWSGTASSGPQPCRPRNPTTPAAWDPTAGWASGRRSVRRSARRRRSGHPRSSR